jgi:hypothetical protein
MSDNNGNNNGNNSTNTNCVTPVTPPPTLCNKVDRIILECLEIRCLINSLTTIVNNLSAVVNANIVCGCEVPPISEYSCTGNKTESGTCLYKP